MTGNDAAAVTSESQPVEVDLNLWPSVPEAAQSDAKMTSPFPALPFDAEPKILSTLAHEMRGPLTALVTSAELLVEDFDALPANQMREMVTTMHRGALWLHGLVENLLAAATIRDGQFQIHRQSVALEDVIEEVRPVVAPILAQKGQWLEVTGQGASPEVSADPRRIGQVLVNLIANASKYMDDRDAIEIALAIRSHSARVTVADRGPGIPEGSEDQLFEPFHRSSSATSSTKEGLGLGLSIVRSIIDAHGGRVGAANRSEGGACFWFELPLTIRVPRLTRVGSRLSDGKADAVPATVTSN